MDGFFVFIQKVYEELDMKKIKNKQRMNASGFTLVEVLVSTLILMPIFLSVMYVFIQGIELSDTARHSSEAVRLLRSKMTEIENTPFNQIEAKYNNITFTANGMNGIGVSYIDDSQPNILDITMTFSWQERSGRTLGEDLDLDGQIDAGEDVNGNNILDSPVTLTTRLYNV